MDLCINAGTYMYNNSHKCTDLGFSTDTHGSCLTKEKSLACDGENCCEYEVRVYLRSFVFVNLKRIVI